MLSGKRLSNLKLLDDKLFFSVDDKFKQFVLDEFTDENSDINPYYPRFKTHQLDILEKDDLFIVNFWPVTHSH